MNLFAAPFLARLAIIFLSKTLRMEEAGRENLEKAGGSVIYAFWHCMMLPMACALKNKRINIMVSRSSDGEIISRTITGLGTFPVRGSTSRGGGEALVKLIKKVRNGEDAAITPDGPRGPAFKAQPGAARIAAKTGRPVVPAAFCASRKITLKSWDSFIVPLPFSRSVLAYGEPVFVSPEDSLQMKTLEIEKRLGEASELAEHSLNKNKTENTDGHTVSRKTLSRPGSFRF